MIRVNDLESKTNEYFEISAEMLTKLEQQKLNINSAGISFEDIKLHVGAGTKIKVMLYKDEFVNYLDNYT